MLALLSILLVTKISSFIFFIFLIASLDLQNDMNTSLIPSDSKISKDLISFSVKSGRRILLFSISTPLLFPTNPDERHRQSK